MHGLALTSPPGLHAQRACLRGRTVPARASALAPARAPQGSVSVVAGGGKKKERKKLAKKIKETQKAVEEITKLLEAAVVAEASTKAEGASDAEARFELERRQFKQKEERLERQVMLLHEEVASLKAQLTSAKVNSQASLELAAPASSVVAAAVRDARNGSTADTALLTKPLPPKPAPAPPKPAAAQPPSPAKPPAAAPAVTAVKAATPKPAAVHPTWPVLSKGSDDIAAMAFLHRMLSEGGFHCGDDDMEDWIFGEGTLNALLTFQEVNGIADTGCTDAATWLALVGQDAMRECPFANADTIISEKMGASSASAGAHADHGAKAGGSHHEKEKEHSSHSSGHTKHAGKWPNLRRDDGGSHVRALQELLGTMGYHSGDEDMHFWFFGQGTEDALRFFQASKSLPETGITCDRTWAVRGLNTEAAALGPRPAQSSQLTLRRFAQVLLGSEKLALGPDVLKTFVDESEDMDQEGVYLLGEDRWERPERVSAGHREN